MNNRNRLKKKITVMLTACIGISLLTGCGSEYGKVYEQAGKDLEQGSYAYALDGYKTCVENGVKLSRSYRGAGLASLRMGDYEQAIENFSSALNCEKVGAALEKDILSYRATAYLKSRQYDNAMADCQTLSEECSMDGDTYFLSGKVALAMDSYEEAEENFKQAYGEESTYDMAIRIYQAYLEKDMEADGTRYLEAALQTKAKTAQDYCDRGRVYYYMEDYDNAGKELIEATRKDSTEALLLLGMVYMAQKDISNSRAMYQQYISEAEDTSKGYNGLALCDIAEKNYDSALENIASGMPSATTEEMQSLLFNEIVVYERKLDFATAQQKAQEYLEMFPDDKAALKEFDFLKTRTGNS